MMSKADRETLSTGAIAVLAHVARAKGGSSSLGAFPRRIVAGLVRRGMVEDLGEGVYRATEEGLRSLA